MQRLKRISKWGLALCLMGALVLVGMRVLRTRSKASQTASLTRLVAVERGDLVASITPTGEVSAQRRAQLSFDVNKIPLIELYVTAGQQVPKGKVLARIDPASLQRAVDQALADLLSAAEALEKAQNPYTELDRKKAELDVAQAQVALEQAKQAGADETVRDATDALQQAKDKLAALQNDPSIQEQIDRLQWLANIAEVEHGKLLEGPILTEEGKDRELLAYNRMLDAQDNLEVARARAALDLLNAQNNVTQAEETLAELSQTGSEPVALAQINNKVAEAEYSLAKAEDNQATILAGPDTKTVQLAQARYDAATATLAKAQAALEAATMVAPFDGTVIAVGAEVGDLVSSGTTIVTLADLSDLRVLAIVDETDISGVQVAQEVQITFDAFPGRKFKGKVLEVPLESTLVQNVVSYEVPVSLEGAEGVALKSGMTANLSIVVGRRQNVLLVPVLAVQQGEDGNVVMVQDSQGAALETRVELGLSDGTYVEVLRGLNEGDQVVVQYQATTQQTNQFGGFGISILGGRLGR